MLFFRAPSSNINLLEIIVEASSLPHDYNGYISAFSPENMSGRNPTFTDVTQVLPETSLRGINQTIRNVVSEAHDPDSIFHLHQLHQDILKTVHATNISLAHSSAALNALCAYIQQCSISLEADVRETVLSRDACNAAFELVITRSENHKSKPLRRLLETLISLLKKHLDDATRQSVVDHVVSICMRAIESHDVNAAIKPCIQVLDFFLKSQIVDARFSAWTVGASSKTLVLKLLRWTEYRDCIPIVSRFLTTFVLSLGSLNEAQSYTIDTELVWLEPIIVHIEKHPGDFEELAKHVLEPLFTAATMTATHLMTRHISAQSLTDAQILVYLVASRIIVGRRIYSVAGNGELLIIPGAS